MINQLCAKIRHNKFLKYVLLLYLVVACQQKPTAYQPKENLLFDHISWEADLCWVDLCIGKSTRIDLERYMEYDANNILKHGENLDSETTVVIITYTEKASAGIYGAGRIEIYIDADDLIRRIAIWFPSNLNFQDIEYYLGEPELVDGYRQTRSNHRLIARFLYPSKGITIWNESIRWDINQTTFKFKPDWVVGSITISDFDFYEPSGWENTTDRAQPWFGWETEVSILE